MKTNMPDPIEGLLRPVDGTGVNNNSASPARSGPIGLPESDKVMGIDLDRSNKDPTNVYHMERKIDIENRIDIDERIDNILFITGYDDEKKVDKAQAFQAKEVALYCCAATRRFAKSFLRLEHVVATIAIASVAACAMSFLNLEASRKQIETVSLLERDGKLLLELGRPSDVKPAYYVDEYKMSFSVVDKEKSDKAVYRQNIIVLNSQSLDIDGIKGPIFENKRFDKNADLCCGEMKISPSADLCKNSCDGPACEGYMYNYCVNADGIKGKKFVSKIKTMADNMNYGLKND